MSLIVRDVEGVEGLDVRPVVVVPRQVGVQVAERLRERAECSARQGTGRSGELAFERLFVDSGATALMIEKLACTDDGGDVLSSSEMNESLHRMHRMVQVRPRHPIEIQNHGVGGAARVQATEPVSEGRRARTVDGEHAQQVERVGAGLEAPS